MKTIRVGLMGFGTIGKVHWMGYQGIPVCYDPPRALPNVAALWRSPGSSPATDPAGIPLVTRDVDEFFAQPLDLIDICTPNHAHLEFALRGLRQGLAVYCEKPLAHTLVEAQQMAELAAQTGALTQVAFTNRFSPAIRQMHALIAAGAIGEPLHFRALKLHSAYLDPQRPLSWRLRMDQSGGGVFMDLGVHQVDLLRYLLGEFVSLRCEMRTVVARRPLAPGSAELGTVDVDDWALCSATLANGCTGVIEVSRISAGENEKSNLTIYGTRGAVQLRGETPETAYWFDLKDKQWRSGGLPTRPAAREHPFEDIWPARKLSLGDSVNRHMTAIYDLLLHWNEGAPASVDFADGLRAQIVVDACYRSAAQGGAPVALTS